MVNFFGLSSLWHSMFGAKGVKKDTTPISLPVVDMPVTNSINIRPEELTEGGSVVDMAFALLQEGVSADAKAAKEYIARRVAKGSKDASSWVELQIALAFEEVSTKMAGFSHNGRTLRHNGNNVAFGESYLYRGADGSDKFGYMLTLVKADQSQNWLNDVHAFKHRLATFLRGFISRNRKGMGVNRKGE